MQKLFRDAPPSINNYLNLAAVQEAFDQSSKNFESYVVSLVPFEHWFECVERRRRTGRAEEVSESVWSAMAELEVRVAGA